MYFMDSGVSPCLLCTEYCHPHTARMKTSSYHLHSSDPVGLFWLINP